jgi:hypothetical protein
MMFHSKKPERVSNYLTLSELTLRRVLVFFFLLFSARLSVLCKFRLNQTLSLQNFRCVIAVYEAIEYNNY